MKIRKQLVPVITLGFCLALKCVIAQAQTTFTLNVDGCDGGCGGTVPYATVTLTQEGSNVIVTETLNPTYTKGFVATGAGRSLEFNITGDPIITIIANPGLTSGFTIGTGTSPGVFEVGPAPAHVSTFGTFDYSVSCIVPSGCGHGASHPDMGPLSFVVKGVTINDFTANGGGFFFASDLQGVNGNTGNIANKTAGVALVTPEPASMLLFGSGLLALGAVLRRRKRTATSA